MSGKRSAIIAAAGFLTLGVLSGVADANPISFAVTATPSMDRYGYSSSQSYTFTWIVNSAFANNSSSDFAGTYNYWSDEHVSETPIFTNVSGDGLTGSWQRPVAGADDPWSTLEILGNSGPTSLTLNAGNDGGYSVGLQADGTGILQIEASHVVIGEIFGFPGSYTDPSEYFAGLTGTYAATAGTLNLTTVGLDVFALSVSSVTISAVPEPSTALLSVLGLLTPMVLRRRSAL